MAKYGVGQAVELTASRFQGEDYEYYPFEFKYQEGNKGNVDAVFNTLADIPEELFSKYLNTTEWLGEGAYYSVKIGLHIKQLVPESAIFGVNNLEQRVEDRIAKAQANKEFKDVGDRVSGTKKEKMATRGADRI